MKANKPIYVTRPTLPPLDEFIPYLEHIWDERWLTNNGSFHQQLERELAAFLGVKHLALVSNGTIGLIVALQALRISGEVITTPYSFVATAHSLLWNNLKPVFVDVDPQTCNLDPDKIEAAITERTTAILPVHCYGMPCDVRRIQQIADKHSVKVVYDAAHAFGVKLNDETLLKHGDLSVLSFHATKVFNTFEGGAIVCEDAELKERIDYLKNFGFADEVTVVMPGINGKMNEFQSALGMLQMKGIEAALQRRRQIGAIYMRGLRSIRGIKCFEYGPEVLPNFGYFPIFVGSDYPLTRDGLYGKMRTKNIFARRYFFPLISAMPMYRDLPSAARTNVSVAADIAEKIICLPIYPDLSDDCVQEIIDIIASK